MSQWAKHVNTLHADGDVGFSQEYDVSQTYLFIKALFQIDCTSHLQKYLLISILCLF